MSIESQHYPQTIPVVASPRASLERGRVVPLLGNVIILVFCTLDFLDWYLLGSDPTGTDTIADPRRLVPHIGRIFLLILMSTILLRYWKRPHKYGLFWAQVAWLLVLTVRYVLAGSFGVQTILECAIYAMAPLAMWTFYILAKTGQLNRRFLVRAGAVMVCLYVFRILLYRSTSEWLGAPASTDDILQSIKASGYSILQFVSLVLLGRYTTAKLWFVALALLAATLSMERSTQIEVIIVFFALLSHYTVLRPHHRRRAVGVAISMIVLLGVTYALNAATFIQRWSDVDQGESAGSGRIDIWGILFSNWWNGGTFVHVLGFGPYSVYEATKAAWLTGVLHAHNEWLQMLYETGLIGLIAYAMVLFLICRITARLLKTKSPGAPAALFASTVILCRSAFDYVLSGSNAVWFCIVIGAAMGTATLVARKPATEDTHGVWEPAPGASA